MVSYFHDQMEVTMNRNVTLSMSEQENPYFFVVLYYPRISLIHPQMFPALSAQHTVQNIRQRFHCIEFFLHRVRLRPRLD